MEVSTGIAIVVAVAVIVLFVGFSGKRRKRTMPKKPLGTRPGGEDKGDRKLP